jgi:hypothetical protein
VPLAAAEARPLAALFEAKIAAPDYRSCLTSSRRLIAVSGQTSYTDSTAGYTTVSVSEGESPACCRLPEMARAVSR